MLDKKQNKALTTLAILKVNSDYLDNDFLDLLKPFIATLIKKKEYSVIKEKAIRKDFKKEFGLDIPHHAFVSILNRCRKQKLLFKEHGKLKPNNKELTKHDFSIETQNQAAKQKQFINEFKKYAKNKYEKEFSNKKAEDILLNYLKKHDIELLYASQNDSLLPKVKKTGKEEIYILADFIKLVCEEKPDLSEYLLNINVGHMLANTFAYDGFINYKGKLKNVLVYLDSPVVFKLFNFDGKHQKNITVELINLIKEQGGELKIFDITYREILANLDNAKHWIHHRNYNPVLASPTLRYFIDNNMTKSDIEKVIISLKSKLDSYDITKVSLNEEFKKPKHQVDENKLEKTIVETYKKANPEFNKSRNDLILEHDISCISNIYFLRKNKNVKSISNSEAIFITNNYGLARAGNKFEKEKSYLNESMPAALSDLFIGTILWLQKPSKAEEISRNKLMADCYVALKPDKTLVKKYIDELKKLEEEGYIRDDESYMLRTNRVALDLLSKETLGDPDNYTAGTAKEIFNEFKNSITKPYKEELDEKDSQHDRTKQKLENKARTESKIKKLINFSSGLISYGVFIILIAAFLYFLYSAYFKPNNEATTVFTILYIIVSILGVAWGFNFLKVRDWINNKVKNKLHSFFEITVEEKSNNQNKK